MLRKFNFIFSFLIITLFASAAETDTAMVYRFGQYNIRIITTEDTGDYQWSERKEALAGLIKKYDFDVWSMNECKSANQFTQLKALLPEYTFVVHGVTSTTISEKGTMNGVVFKTDKFELLDKGRWFISASPETSSRLISDSRQQRGTVWVKLRTKTTGEIFYYFATHLDHIGKDSRREGARININMVRKVAGNYPAIIGGDHNTAPEDIHVGWCLKGYFKSAGTEFPPKQYPGTHGWSGNDADYSGSPIDYLYGHHVTIKSYTIIRDKMERSIQPSDHCPIMAEMTLDSDIVSASHYVHNAAELQEALSTAQMGDTIYATAGTYTPSAIASTSANALFNVPASITILGGYNEDFSEIVGQTILTAGTFTQQHTLAIAARMYCELSHIDITASNSSLAGAGIFHNGSYLVLNDCNLYGNTTASQGAAIYASGQIDATHCTFYDNHAEGNGGAIYTSREEFWRYTFRHCHFYQNESDRIGGAAYIRGMKRGYFSNCTFNDNKAVAAGGGLFLGNTANQIYTLTFLNNTFFNNAITGTETSEPCEGSAIYAELHLGETQVQSSTLQLVANTITCNKGAAAVKVKGGYLGLFNNILAGNAPKDVILNGTLLNTQNNIFTHAASVSGFEISATDIVGSTPEAGTAAIKELLPDTLNKSAQVLIPKIATFENKSIVCVPAAWITESALKADLNDDTALMTEKYTDDQQGTPRKLPYTIGAVEYDPASGIKDADDDGSNLSTITSKLIYNLCGQRLNTLQRGFNIVNGKKIIL